MRGLILKDLLVLKAQGRMFLMCIILFFVGSLFTDDSSFFYQGFLVILLGMMPITALAYDERARWDGYVLSMPVSRADVVMSKYWLALGLMLAGVLAGFVTKLITAGTMALGGEFWVVETVMLAVGLLFVSLNMPLMFKLGTEKGRLVFMGLAVLCMFSPMLGEKLLEGGGGMELSENMPGFLSMALLTMVMLALFFVSSRISIGIYSRKEL